MLDLGYTTKAAGLAGICASRQDFRRIFLAQTDSLYTLAFLLTDDNKSEACLVAGLEDSLHENLVLRQWANAWARRAIIRNAVRLIGPQSGCSGLEGHALSMKPRTDQEWLIEAVVKLPAFERFVFVISVLEGHSVSDTASMLNCTNSQLSRARFRALEYVARVFDSSHTCEHAGVA